MAWDDPFSDRWTEAQMQIGARIEHLRALAGLTGEIPNSPAHVLRSSARRLLAEASGHDEKAIDYAGSAVRHSTQASDKLALAEQCIDAANIMEIVS